MLKNDEIAIYNSEFFFDIMKSYYQKSLYLNDIFYSPIAKNFTKKNLKEYIEWSILHSDIETACVYPAFTYLVSFLKLDKFILNKHNWFTLILIAFTVASKMWDDYPVVNSNFSILLSSEMDPQGESVRDCLKKFNEAEKYFLKQIDYRLYLNRNDIPDFVLTAKIKDDSKIINSNAKNDVELLLNKSNDSITCLERLCQLFRL